MVGESRGPEFHRNKSFNIFLKLFEKKIIEINVNKSYETQLSNKALQFNLTDARYAFYTERFGKKQKLKHSIGSL